MLPDKGCPPSRLTSRATSSGQGQMGTERFPRQAEDYQHTDSPASTRPGFQMSCQMAASKGWDLFHIDHKTAFLQGESFDVNRDVVCQLPPEAGHPPKKVARLKKPAYGMNDAPRRWWNILDKGLRSYGMVPTRAGRCCYVLYSIQSRERAWEHWGQRTIAQKHGTRDALTESRGRPEMEAAFGINAGSHSRKPSYRKIRGRNHQSLCG